MRMTIPQKTSRIIVILFLILTNVGCDQISKNVVRNTIRTYDRIEVFKQNFIITKVENNGAAWSIGSDLNPILKIAFLQIVPLIFLVLLLRLILIKTNYPKEVLLGFTFVIGGGIGNLYDRIAHGSVTDFLILDFGIISTEIFNMADVSITLGVILVIVSSFFNKKRGLLQFF